jgi:mannose-6-phosphate isomerase-like protein (cupin superfamily)
MSLQDRLVRYRDLKPCLNAFIDTRSPGSDKKENFTIIGPGVSENPEQFIHVAIPHGFNIGGARQPPGCLNSQHSHLTAEVFLVHSGTWAFRTGEHASDGEIILHEGDVISLPTNVFRGFENIGDDEGYLYAILGGDDPGRVMWAPDVFDMAGEYGLILLEDGSLIDTTVGQVVPGDKQPMPRTSAVQVASLNKISSEALNHIVIRAKDYQWSDGSALSAFEGVQEAALLGPANEEENLAEASLSWPHDFVFRALTIESGVTIPAHHRAEEEVLFVLQGTLVIEVDGETVELKRGDNFTTPIGSSRSFSNPGSIRSLVYITRRTDQPEAPRFD